jgi:hypothetical protein
VKVLDELFSLGVIKNLWKNLFWVNLMKFLYSEKLKRDFAIF